MTGIERLRELVAGISPITVVCGVTRTSYDREHMEVAGKRLRDFLADIADQIEREQGSHVSRMRVLSVITDMERHVLGHEGMEDSPVARWARELREALGTTMSRQEGDSVAGSPCDDLTDEEVEDVATVRADAMEAWRWVCDHGGIEGLRSLFQDADSRRVELCAALGIDLDKGWSEAMAAMRLRLMPEGMEWPRFEDGEPVRIGDKFECWCGEEHVVGSVSFRGSCGVLNMSHAHTFVVGHGPETVHGERVKRPEPKVLDADGAEIREKCDVWWICEGDERGVHAERLRVETICPNGLIECSPYNGGTWVYLEPSELYVNKPVPSSDGRPLREGDTVYHVNTGTEYSVRSVTNGGAHLSKGDKPGGYCRAEHLTHERPDSLDRLAEDIGAMVVAWRSNRDLFDAQEAAAGCVGENTLGAALDDLVRRAKALAERERGE